MERPNSHLRRRLRGAGITILEAAQVLGEKPGTTGNRLGGFLPLSKEQADKLLAYCEAKEKQLQEAEAAQAREAANA